MISEFNEAVSEINNRHVKDWKGKGKKIIGYTCSYVPDEILHAADILPYRIRGLGAGETTIGDTYFGPFICSLPKSILQLVGEGKFDFLDGAVIVPGCDSMRRLDECWRKAGDDHVANVPGFFFHFGVPHKYADYTIRWFKDEIDRLIQKIDRHFNIKISEDKLKNAVRVYNKSRRLLDEFDEIRIRLETPLSGAEALAIVLAGAVMPREIYNKLLEGLINELKESGDLHKNKLRFMLVGSANDDIRLVEIIEGDNAIVVADNLCFGARFHNDPVDEEGDPLNAIARRYLAKNECPRMYGEYKNRLKTLKTKAETAKVDGVILQNIRFCDLHGSENSLFERDLEAAGIPCIRLEREYSPLVETGRIRMRLDAFIERIIKRREIA